MDWLLAPIDPTRAHEVGLAISWHGRAMVLAWGVLAPLAVIAARFLKILPWQDWPRELDSHVWWRSHWIGQSVVVLLSVVGVALVASFNPATMTLHNWLGYTLLLVLCTQVILGLFRGSKGGPTALAPDGSPRGHHYDMTPWRLTFEALHKTLGYGALALAAAVILTGLWKANAPVFMWLAILLWWALLGVVFTRLQQRGMAIDTYQAIWGDDPKHPGNQRPRPGWGMRRPAFSNEDD
ncbi:MAG: cytochrome B [Pseudomonadota bacterium]